MYKYITTYKTYKIIETYEAFIIINKYGKTITSTKNLTVAYALIDELMEV